MIKRILLSVLLAGAAVGAVTAIGCSAPAAASQLEVTYYYLPG